MKFRVHLLSESSDKVGFGSKTRVLGFAIRVEGIEGLSDRGDIVLLHKVGRFTKSGAFLASVLHRGERGGERGVENSELLFNSSWKQRERGGL